jgi:hypothetical protein
MRHTLSLLVSVLFVLVGSVVAGQEITDAQKAAAMKLRLLRTPIESRIKIGLRDGEEVLGRLTRVTETSFSVCVEDSGETRNISFADIATLEIFRALERGRFLTRIGSEKTDQL